LPTHFEFNKAREAASAAKEKLAHMKKELQEERSAFRKFRHAKPSSAHSLEFKDVDNLPAGIDKQNQHLALIQKWVTAQAAEMEEREKCKLVRSFVTKTMPA
jgi:hypothetical protein